MRRKVEARFSPTGAQEGEFNIEMREEVNLRLQTPSFNRVVSAQVALDNSFKNSRREPLSSVGP